MTETEKWSSESNVVPRKEKQKLWAWRILGTMMNSRFCKAQFRVWIKPSPHPALIFLGTQWSIGTEDMPELTPGLRVGEGRALLRTNPRGCNGGKATAGKESWRQCLKTQQCSKPRLTSHTTRWKVFPGPPFQDSNWCTVFISQDLLAV